MTEKYKIIITDPFKKELRNILYYISYKFNEPSVAERKFNKIVQKVFTLDKFPQRCPKIQNYKENIRKLIFDNYIVIFQIHEDTRASIYFTYI